ncbi:hypothetical protein K505DRAFT_326811 [Melanomma pulvis-pyrius CBS 109.77]|uniref:Myb-like domain-containing protein n=1 Tax=Melanomma pulvis-pyrius CBS 109.77 TaxID=1314802 RepID=A0A6A6X5I0_9PLEO|nr:hypothetical protein K505DRAFT_326811 [Melanomma pulvis-pyrius CBS 109.77]
MVRQGLACHHNTTSLPSPRLGPRPSTSPALAPRRPRHRQSLALAHTLPRAALHMADRRAVRSSSRGITPAPQRPSAATTPQSGRVTRTRGARSAGRDVVKPARRGIRQASVASVASESDREGPPTKKTARKAHTKAQEQPVRDLTTVEEVDTEISTEFNIDDASVTPPKQRTAFGRGRRRSSRKFDPNADSDFREVDALKARERAARQPQAEPPHQEQQPEVELQEGEEGVVYPFDDQEEVQPLAADDIDHVIDVDDQEEVQPIADDDIEHVLDVDNQEDQQQPQAPTALSGPPRTAAELEQLTRSLIEATKPQYKENLRGGFFARQPNAERVEFGDGFDDSQPAPGPSYPSGKGKETQLSSPKKRRQDVVWHDSDDDTFESIGPSSKAQERRQQAPVAKRVRIDPTSFAAPPSHQPPLRNDNQTRSSDVQEESLSEADAPDMTEEAPPPSSYARIRELAQKNTAPRPRKRPIPWSPQQEAALEEYVGALGPKYAQILSHDASNDGLGLLQDRTQVNLKDKVRNMAITMIKSRAPLSNGFEGIISPTSVVGRRLIEDGFDV